MLEDNKTKNRFNGLLFGAKMKPLNNSKLRQSGGEKTVKTVP